MRCELVPTLPYGVGHPRRTRPTPVPKRARPRALDTGATARRDRADRSTPRRSGVLEWVRPEADPPSLRVPGRCPGWTYQILATWVKDSSTGVSRPKIDTSTLSFWVSGLISLTVAGSVANGPSITVTDSPTS